MKRFQLVWISMLAGLLLSSCGAIPTLPSLDSTVIIKTPIITADPGLSGAAGQTVLQETPQEPLESPSAPPETVAVMPQPTQQPKPTETVAGEAPSGPTATQPSEENPPPLPTSAEVSYPYKLQVLNPHYLGNFTRPDLGCDWLGVGGQIFDRDGAVQKNIIIKAGGELDGDPVIEKMTLPLAEPDIDIAYGPGGFELTLANSPTASDSTLWVQLFSLDGKALSEQIFLITYQDCQKNLLLMNFVEE
jgi:hypothetical protein